MAFCTVQHTGSFTNRFIFLYTHNPYTWVKWKVRAHTLFVNICIVLLGKKVSVEACMVDLLIVIELLVLFSSPRVARWLPAVRCCVSYYTSLSLTVSSGSCLTRTRGSWVLETLIHTRWAEHTDPLHNLHMITWWCKPAELQGFTNTNEILHTKKY